MAFALLTSHYHLVLEVEENRLQPGMKWLNGTRRQRMRAFRYVALDPVRAGLVERPDDWVWSSYAGTAGYTEPFTFVDDRPIRECFGTGPDGLEFLRAFVEEAVDPVTKP
jgi:putative transposase